MSLIQSTAIATADTGFNIPYSLRFDDDAGAYLSRTPGSAGNRKTWTLSFWIKWTGQEANNTVLKTAGGSGDTGFSRIYFTDDKELTLTRWYSGVERTSGVHRDTAAWYHFVFRCDTTQSTAIDRWIIYRNGVRDDSEFNQHPTQNQDGAVNNNQQQILFGPNGSERMDAYVADLHMIDGQSLAPTEFAETDEDWGHWKPKKYTGSYGTQGYHLEFKQTGTGQSASTAGADTSGNDNHFDAVTLSTHDQMLDTPTNNFCTMDPNARDWAGAVRSKATLSQGNLYVLTTSSDTRTQGTMACNRDGQKYYWEILLRNSVRGWVGIHDPENSDASRVLYDTNGNKTLDGTTNSYGESFNGGTIIGIAVDEPNNQVTFYKNNSSQGTISYTFDDKYTYLPTVWRNASGNAQWIFNFGQDSSFAGDKSPQGNGDYDFYYTPPSGFKALCTKDLPDPAIKPKEHFSVGIYDGNTSNPRNITGVGFEPDFVWLKARNYSYEQLWIDRYRGVGQRLYSHNNSSESTNTSTISAFVSDGFTVGNGTGMDLSVNGSGRTYVHYNWKVNGTTTVSNTSGDINCTQSVNTAAGFSISTYTGVGGEPKTIGHGLSKAPEWIMIKKRNSNGNWVLWNHMLPDNYAYEGTWAQGVVNGGSPISKYIDAVSSTLVTLGDAGENNQDNDTYVMYCFHGVEGYSKFGEYEGNGNNDGTYVNCGFKPAFVHINAQYGEHSTNHDYKRSPDNPAIETLMPGSSGTEETHSYNYIDILSNGFKIRTSDYRHNKANDYLSFMAFAEEPFKYATAR